MNERETSQVTSSLANRLSVNNTKGDNDLTIWLVRNMGLREGERIFENGCGTGKHLIRFAEILSEEHACVGMDISKTSLQVAQQETEKRNLHIDWLHGSMNDDISFDRSFDTVCFIYSLYYSDHPGQTLENASRLIKDDGRIVVVGPYRDNNQKWFEFLKQFMPLTQQDKKSGPRFMHEVVARFAITHFENIKMDRFVNSITINSIDELRTYWRSTIYYKEKYDDLFEAHAIKHFRENETFSYDKVALMIKMRERL